jgi:hypothetical protein
MSLIDYSADFNSGSRSSALTWNDVDSLLIFGDATYRSIRSKTACLRCPKDVIYATNQNTIGIVFVCIRSDKTQNTCNAKANTNHIPHSVSQWDIEIFVNLFVTKFSDAVP